MLCRQIRKNIAAPKTIYGLFRIANQHQGARLLKIDLLKNAKLNGIGILELIHQRHWVLS